MLLTTHYMEEADHLCDRLAIIDNGKIVVEGTPAELKRSIGADTVVLELPEPSASGSVELVRARLDGLVPAEAVAAHPTRRQPLGRPTPARPSRPSCASSTRTASRSRACT